MPIVALWLIASVSAAPIALPPDLPADGVLRLLRKTPHFCPASGRMLQSLTRSASLPWAFVIEFQWSEKGAMHTGVADIEKTAPAPNAKWLAVDGGWGVASIEEDKDLIQTLHEAVVAAHEAAVRGDIRAILSAEDAFHSAAGGRYGDWKCLAKPGTCLPTYGGSPLLDRPESMLGEVNGYRRTFHAGPPARGRAGPGGLLESFAVTAVPLHTGDGRSFCADSSGRKCIIDDGSPPPVGSGACGTPCKDWP